MKDGHNSNQAEFSFDTTSANDGLKRWNEERRAAREELSRQTNLPIGHRTEVYLPGNVRLRGRLLLKEEKLTFDGANARKLRMIIDGVEFAAEEVVQFTRLD